MTGELYGGRPVTEVQVAIDHAILQHFSQHLYSSPNKAVEELVTNGYDALAQEVHIHLPGEVAEDCAIVWDDGDSMDIEGIRQLWWIARSPKTDDGDRVAHSARRDVSRAMIGKFGIGKLASYAVGQRISHLCHRDGNFYLVTVDYNQAPRVDSEDTSSNGFQVPVLELDESQARHFALSLYRNRPSFFDHVWNKSSWTLAVIDDIKTDVHLRPGRLRWVLGNGMPSRVDFNVYVDDVKVTPKIEKDAIVQWDASAEKLRRQLERDWKAAVQDGLVNGTVQFATDGDGSPVFRTPLIGDISVQVKLFGRSLYKKGADEAGRSQGFFVMVRDRLLNPDDPKLLLPDPSYGAFNRMQIFMWANGLDSELLADRERLHRATGRGRELEVVQQAIYRAARQYIEQNDAAENDRETIAELPTASREFIREPLTALIIDDPDTDLGAVDPAKTRLTSEPAGDGAPLMRLDSVENRLLTNSDHPLFNATVQAFGNTKHARQAQKLIELVAFADTLLRGHLLDVGLDSELVESIIGWRDAQLRTLAEGFGTDSDLLVKEVVDTSYKGDKEFEVSLSKLFRSMGFEATVDGVPGAKDVLVIAPVGENEQRFTIEAKGSKRKIPNDAAEVSAASAHAKSADASFSLVVAREFAGFARNSENDAAIIDECQRQDPPVSISTVYTLVDLYHAVQKHQYPLVTIGDSLAAVESPQEKTERVATLDDPLRSNLDWRGIFNEIWRLQQDTAQSEPVSIRQVRQNPAWKDRIDDKAFLQLLFGLESLSGGLLVVHSNRSDVNLLQAPSLVSQRIIGNFESATTSERTD